MQFILGLMACLTLLVSIRKHRLFSFVTLGVLGAALYSIPGIIGWELSLTPIPNRRSPLVPTTDDVDTIVAVAWAGLLAGVIAFSPRAEQRHSPRAEQRHAMGDDYEEGQAYRLAFASAMLGGLGLFYLFYTQGFGMLAQARDEQITDPVLLIWRWVAPFGLVASALAKSRTLVLFHAMILFVIFVRGDRTMIAISTAAMLVVMARAYPQWYRFLSFNRLIGIAAAAIGVFFGKSVYLTLKIAFAGGGWNWGGRSTTEAFYSQFEPFVIYAHMNFVIRHDLHLSIKTFIIGLLSNLLIIPSMFGFSSNTYSDLIEKHQSLRIWSGLAGNYLANGYILGGTVGAIFFYFMLAFILRQCDSRFQKSHGTWKLFWCCTGGLFAFYVHRNGLDNMFSFVRQLAILSLLAAGIALALSPGVRRIRLGQHVPREPMGFDHSSRAQSTRRYRESG